jgi:hypothetical protein
MAIRRYFDEHPSSTAISGQTRYYDLPLENFSRRVSSFFVDDLNRAVSGFASLYGPNMALRRTTARWLARVGCEGNVNEDLDLTIHLIERGDEIGSEPEMLAYISGRRLKSSPLSFYRYCRNWPRTYARHGELQIAAKLNFIIILSTLLQTCIALPACRVYDLCTRQLTWREFWRYSDDRIIP